MLELHPDMDRLRQFALGRVGGVDAANLEDHIMHCEECCEKLRQVDNDRLVTLAQEAARQAMIAEEESHIPRELHDHPRYRILSQLGEGGMGTVFKAEHRLMDRVVALKVIQRKYVNNLDAVERFRNEVRMAAKLHHPNIVAAHDAEEANGLHFLVMEFVDGISLDRFVTKQKGPIPYPLACHIIRQAAIGLQHAHSHGLVHRDIKPQNIMMTRKGQVKILDFGLTRLNAEAGFDGGMTRENLVVGTPDFIAPEQARNSRDVDIRTDIYALGCTFYYLLTRRVPFPGLTAFEKMLAHAEIEPHPVGDYRKDFPAELDAIIRKMMAKRREDRFQLPSEIVLALSGHSRLNVNTATTSAVIQPIHSESEAEVVTEKVDTDDLKDSHTNRYPQPATPPRGTPVVRPRPRSAPRRRRGSKKLPYRTWIAGTIIGTLCMFAFIFVVARSGRNNPNDKLDPKDPLNLVQGEIKQPKVNPVPSNDKDIFKLKPDEVGKQPFENDSAFGKETLLVPNNKFKGPPPKPFGKGREPNPNDARDLPLKGKSVLLVVPNRGAWFPDLDPVRELLESRGASIHILSTDLRVCSGLGGTRTYKPNFNISYNMNIEFFKRYSAIICGGGEVGEFLSSPRNRANLERILTALNRENKLIASIGTGQAILAKSGHLEGKDVAKVSVPQASEKFELNEKKYPRLNWSDQKVVRSGNVVTASGQEAAKEFADEIVRLLQENR